MAITRESLKAFGSRLREIRKQKFTTAQFSKKIHKDVGTIRNYESGNYLPSVKTLIEIIEALQVNPDYLLGPLIETHLDDELNKMIERIKLIYEHEGEREALKVLLSRYTIPGKENG